MSFGENLRRERELRGVSLREIAEATKISVRFLDALEHDRIDVLPGGLFPRAFVRQYARHLGLDAERLVDEFVHATGAEPERVARHPPAPHHGTPRPQRSAPPLGWLVVAAVAVAAAAWMWKGRAEPVTEAVPATESPVLPPSPVMASDRVYPPPTIAAPVQAVPAGQSLVLTLTAKQECWVEAQVDGATVLSRVLAQGETETITAEETIVLSLGNAGGVSFRVNDRPGVPLGREGEVRRNIVITRQSLPSLLQDGGAARPQSG